MILEQLTIWQWLLITVLLVYIVTLVSTIIVIIYDHISPAKAMAWILVIIFLPLIGVLLYSTFGRNYRKRRLFEKKEEDDIQRFPELIIEDIEWEQVEDTNLSQNEGIIRLLKANNKAPLTSNNKLDILENGKETFDAILKAIGQAKHQIHLEYYIFEDGEIGQKLKHILAKKAHEGLEVRLIYDAVGSWDLRRKFLKSLKKQDIQAVAFFPVRFPILASRINYRNHRKIVVVDGHIAFVGGVNISDKYLGTDPEVGKWRDTHLRLEGDAARCLQAVFIRDWFFANHEKIKGYVAEEHANTGQSAYVQIASSGPDSDYASIMQAYFTAITTAQDHVYISTPYFVPNEAISTAIKTAVMRGVKVRLMVPEKSDSVLLNYGLRAFLEEFLEVGVRINLYKKGFNHGKIIMVDSRFCSIGTANLDMRSFDQNFEVNALIYDKRLTLKLEERFMQDLKDSDELKLETFRQSRKRNRLLEGIAKLVSPLL